MRKKLTFVLLHCFLLHKDIWLSCKKKLEVTYRKKPHILIYDGLQHGLLAEVCHLGQCRGDWSIASEHCINRFYLPGEPHGREERWDCSLVCIISVHCTIHCDVGWTRRSQSWLLDTIITTVLITLFTDNPPQPSSD